MTLVVVKLMLLQSRNLLIQAIDVLLDYVGKLLDLDRPVIKK